MSSIAVSVCGTAALAVALAGAIYAANASFTRVPKRIRDTTTSAWLRACAILTTIWIGIWLITAIIRAVFVITHRLPVFWYGLGKHLAMLNGLTGASAICLLLIIQTVILSISTWNAGSSIRDFVHGPYRFIILGLLLLLPLSVASVVLSEYQYLNSGDMGHLRSIIALFLIDGLIAIIKLVAVGLNLIFLRSKARSSPVPYHKPLLIINLLSFGRDAFQVIFKSLIRLGLARKNGKHLPVNAVVVLRVLNVIIVAWVTVACLIMVVDIVADYASAPAEPAVQPDEQPDETSPLLGRDESRVAMAA
ncbi:unnamed protein product [Clonostachys byssicola]|uniref:Uncharacterized protein n=1 Tax=Clonostachys byssicola TaxID=160290 RepID=A0A9N9UIG0_9HYPO|nr:unnamed protein product [Clonostachys byssicola]